jgi:tRNA C32,U32 (ribose-2'-O)-methylase TrmJ
MVYAYELGQARRQVSPTPGPVRADDEALRQVRHSMELGLAASGFLRADSDDRHAIDDAMRSLIRARLTRAEAELWTAMFRVVANFGKPGHPTPGSRSREG